MKVFEIQLLAAGWCMAHALMSLAAKDWGFMTTFLLGAVVSFYLYRSLRSRFVIRRRDW